MIDSDKSDALMCAFLFTRYRRIRATCLIGAESANANSPSEITTKFCRRLEPAFLCSRRAAILVAGDQEAEDVDGSLNEDLWLHRAGEPEMREGEGAGELLEQGAVVRPAHRENHQHSALERHALAPQLVQAGVDVGAGNPEIAPGELDGREEVEAEDGDFSDVWRCSTLPWA
jgi:hypothetical protein